MKNQLSEFLDMELLSRLPTVELRARFIIDGYLTGIHRSPLKGSSVEFMEYRDYQQGDDPKIIDWKTYARTDRLHVRLREDETNMRVYILLDKSMSMDYKSKNALMTKWDYARSITAALLLFLHRQRDHAALGFAGEKLEDFINGERGRASQLNSMMARLQLKADSPKSNLSVALEELTLRIRKRSIVIVISDFYEDPEKLKAAMKQLRYMNCETILFHVLDPAEIDFDFNEPGIFVELENNSELNLSPDLIRKKYRAAISRHIENISRISRETACDSLLLPTNTVPLHALGLYVSRRKGY